MTASLTESILNHHFEAFDRQDLDDVLADYALDAVLMVHEKAYRGQAEIRSFFDDFMHQQLPPESQFDLLNMQVIDKIGYIVWKAQTPNQMFEFATDTFVIENGKIQYQTFACLITTKV